MNELIFGLDNPGNNYVSWPNGWPTDEQDIEKFCYSNYIIGNHQMISFAKNKNDIIEVLHIISHPLSPIFRKNGLYKENLFCIKKSETIHNEMYIYPFEILGGGFYYIDYWEKYGINISDKVKNDCRNGFCKILIYELLEGHGFNKFRVKEFIERQSEILQIPKDSFIFCDANFLTPELQKSYFLKGFFSNYFEKFSPPLTESEYEERLMDLQNPSDKKYYFLNLNSRERLHRTNLILQIFEKWSDKFLWSYNSFFPKRENSNLPDELLNILPKNIDIDYTINDVYKKYEIQTQAYIDIVSETFFFEKETIFFSEKIFKSISCLQPFIVISTPNYLKSLRKIGYKTFSPFINEEYDLIEDDIERFQSVCNEIDRIYKLSLDDIKKLYKNCMDVCIHNYELYKKMNDNEGYLRDKTLLNEIKEYLQFEYTNKKIKK